MEIIRIFRDDVSFRDIAVCLVSRRCHSVCISNAFCLFQRLLRPDTGLKIRSLLLEEVHSHIEELHACTASEEKDLMRVRYIEKLSPQRAAFIHDLAPLL